LKPENVLVGEDGYLLVADFGLAKAVNNSELANSFCGTAEYLAPEMLIGNGHDYTVDWWALGILIYEMIVGIPPFFHRNKHRMYFLIRESPVNFPDPVRHKITVSPEAQDLIVKLLDKNRKTRLGANGIDEILNHPWFADIDKEKLIAKQLDPPYVPQTKDDLAYFDKNLVKQSATEVADTMLTPSQ
jgi:serum/glucocorticoid-regulated kinase 2